MRWGCCWSVSVTTCSFRTDIEVFYVAPPALDEYRRWVDAWLARQRAAQAEAMAGEDIPEFQSDC